MADSLKVNLLIQRADAHAQNSQLDSAALCYEQAGWLSQQIGWMRGNVQAQRGSIRVLDRKGNYKEALEIALQVLEMSRSLGKPDLSISYNYLGNLYATLGKLDESASSYLNALQLAEEAGDAKNQMKYSANLSSIFTDLEDYEKSHLYADYCYRLALEQQDSLNLGYGLAGIAYTELRTKQYQQAAAKYQQVLRIGQVIHNPLHEMIAYANLGEIAYYQGRYQDALAYYRQGLQVLHEYPRMKTELSIYFGMAQAYTQLEMYAEADHYLQKALQIARTVGASNQLRQLFREGSEIYEKMGKPLLALDLRKKYEDLKDSVLNLRTMQNIHRLEIEFQTTRQEKEIAQQKLLITRSQLELQRKNTLIYMALALSVILCAALGLFYLIYCSRQRAIARRRQHLERENNLKILMASMQGEEKERARMARELHDGVGGMLSATKMHLSVLRNQQELLNLTEAIDNSTLMIDRACREVRTIAHHLSPELLQRYSLEEALSFFCRSMCSETLQLEFYCLGEPIPLKHHHKLMYYRLLQELVQNLIRHTGASQALVQLSYHQGLISFTVEDNGSGLRAGGGQGQSLQNIKQRVENLGGKFSIESEEDRGTTVYLEFEAAVPARQETAVAVAG